MGAGAEGRAFCASYAAEVGLAAYELPVCCMQRLILLIGGNLEIARHSKHGHDLLPGARELWSGGGAAVGCTSVNLRAAALYLPSCTRATASAHLTLLCCTGWLCIGNGFLSQPVSTQE